MRIQEIKIKFIKKENILVFFGIFCAVLFFAAVISANTPDDPYPAAAWTNIQVCTNPPNATFDGEDNAFINFTIVGQNMIGRWVEIFSDQQRTQLIFDSGLELVAYQYSQGASSDTRPTPRCACDTDATNVNCGASFSGSAGDPAVCYDWYVRSYQVPSGEDCGTSDQWNCPGGCSLTWVSEGEWGYYICCCPTYESHYVDASYQYNKGPGSLPPGSYSYQVPLGIFEPGETYYYNIAAQSSYNNEWTPWARGNLCNHPPTPLPQPAVQPDYCVVASPSVTLSWDFTDNKIGGDTLSAYQVQISEESDFSPLLVDTGKVSSGDNTSFATSAITWNKTYYWRVKVWDSCDMVSGGDAFTSGPSFSTISHAKPKPDFNWFPTNPAVDETVLFRDESVAYGGYSISDGRVWTFEDSTMVRPDEINPIVKFNNNGLKAVTLTVTDTSPEAFTCAASKTVEVGGVPQAATGLPCWREINPH